MRIISIWLVLALLVSGFASVCSPTASGQGNSPHAVLFEEAHQGLRSLRDAGEGPFVATVSYTRSDNQSPQKLKYTFRIKRCKGLYLSEIVMPSGVPGDRFQFKEVQAINSRYSFVLVDRGQGWVLRQQDNSEQRNKNVLQESRRSGLNVFDLPWTVGGYSLPEMFHSRDLVITQFAKSTHANNGKQATLDFAIPAPTNPDREARVAIERGRVHFDCEKMWRIDSYHYQLPPVHGSGAIKGELKYQESGFLQQFEQTTQFDVTNYSASVTISVVDFETRESSEHEFTLSAFGLPEPPGVTWERPTPTYVWLLLAAGGFGVLALGCRWLLKRRAKAVPTPPSVG